MKWGGTCGGGGRYRREEAEGGYDQDTLFFACMKISDYF